MRVGQLRGERGEPGLVEQGATKGRTEYRRGRAVESRARRNKERQAGRTIKEAERRAGPGGTRSDERSDGLSEAETETEKRSEADQTRSDKGRTGDTVEVDGDVLS